MATYRVAADVAERWLASIGIVLCAVQIAFAALGFWGATENPNDQAAGIAAFEPHAMNGAVLSYLAVVLFILGIVSRANVKAWLLPIIVAVLLFLVQGLLVGLGFEVSRWYGALHAFSGTAITAGFVWLAVDRWMHPLSRRNA
ncbi:MAG: hypothetical protein ABI255_02000 [Microbacteriaceae bacterium]